VEDEGRRKGVTGGRGPDGRRRRRDALGLDVFVWLNRQQVLDGLVVMIRLSHSRERGSIPRRGKHFLFGFRPSFPSLPSLFSPLSPASFRHRL
jgi:hypothetical protein